MVRNSKILVAGGSGFIGSNLCAKLCESDDNLVICIDNNYTSNINNVSNLVAKPNFKYKNILPPFYNFMFLIYNQANHSQSNFGWSNIKQSEHNNK